jgi:hypothetical protein
MTAGNYKTCYSSSNMFLVITRVNNLPARYLLFAIMEKYSITAKLFCITMDNAFNNRKMMTHLSNIFK